MSAQSWPMPYNASGRRYGGPERALLAEVLARSTLTRWGGVMVDQLEEEWCGRSGAGHAIATSSGTTALHTALAALDLMPGTGVIVPPITDMGTLAAVLQAMLIPVFADTDPNTGMMTETTIRAAWTESCGAILFVHLFGRCADLCGVREFADAQRVPLVEDASQAHFAERGGRQAGRVGHIAALSLQQSKVVSCGEGGIVVTDDEDLASRARLFQNKGWVRGQPGNRAYPVLGHNFRMSELAAAVALAQLRQVDQILDDRAQSHARLCTALDGVQSLMTMPADPDELPSWWAFLVHAHRPCVARAVATAGLPFARGYIGTEPIFRADVIAKRRGPGGSSLPWSLNPAIPPPAPKDLPGSLAFLGSALTMVWCEGLDNADVDRLGQALATAVGAPATEMPS